MIDVHYDIFVWVGWWPVQTDVRFREKNQFTGDAIVRFTRDKRLALQTALNYAKGVCVCVCVCVFMYIVGCGYQ